MTRSLRLTHQGESAAGAPGNGVWKWVLTKLPLCKQSPFKGDTACGRMLVSFVVCHFMPNFQTISTGLLSSKHVIELLLYDVQRLDGRNVFGMFSLDIK